METFNSALRGAFVYFPQSFLGLVGRTKQQRLAAWLLWVVTACSLLVWNPAACFGQRTVVRDAGGGRKLELVYDAAGHVVEMRTLDQAGRLQERVEHEYRQGFYVPQGTTTSYWPDGKSIRSVSRESYDENANFTKEVVAVFDESGKQTGGHTLTHDPFTGIYRCADWSMAAQDYQAIVCPAGEEQSSEPKVIRKFTYDEVMKNLEAARNAARQEQKIRHMRPMTPIHPSITTAQREVGLVLPAQLRAGERISGTVVENPEQYDEMPEVTVTRIALPFESGGEASRLSGWRFEADGEEPRPADGPIALVVPSAGSALNITFRQAGNPASSVSKMLNFPQPPANAPRPLASFQAAALCLKGELCAVSGPFSGDSRKTLAAFEGRPATIVAETSQTAYLSIPEFTAPGARPLFLAEGSKVVALPVVVGEFVIRNDGRDLKAGETLITFPTLDGPGDLPEAAWRARNFPATNLERARQFIPAYQLPERDREAEAKGEANEKADREEHGEAEEKNGGVILLVVKNVTPEQISLRSSNNGMLIFHLGEQAFQRGPFKYDLVVEAKRAGKVEVKGYVIPLLAPVTGQEFSVEAAR